jgi:hypothetical protein
MDFKNNISLKIHTSKSDLYREKKEVFFARVHPQKRYPADEKRLFPPPHVPLQQV